MALILASSSPRRRELLEKAGVRFSVAPAEVDESLRPGEPAAAYVERLAREKALAVARQTAPGDWVLGADTAVVAAGQILGKPRDQDDAMRMLRLLSGGSHYVVTGFCIARAPDSVEALRHVASSVIFRPLTTGEMQEYIKTGESFGKAGAYAIQENGDKFVERIEGDLNNIVGLPVADVLGELRRLGAI